MVAFMAGQVARRKLGNYEDVGRVGGISRADADAHRADHRRTSTAGTGSEVARASVLTNSKTQRSKRSIFHPKSAAQFDDLADPELEPRALPTYHAGHADLMPLPTASMAFSSPHFHPMSQGIALEGNAPGHPFIICTRLCGRHRHPKRVRSWMAGRRRWGRHAFPEGLGANPRCHEPRPIGAVFNSNHGTHQRGLQCPLCWT